MAKQAGSDSCPAAMLQVITCSQNPHQGSAGTSVHDVAAIHHTPPAAGKTAVVGRHREPGANNRGRCALVLDMWCLPVKRQGRTRPGLVARAAPPFLSDAGVAGWVGRVCDGTSSPSSYQVISVWPVRAMTLHRSRSTNRTKDTMVTMGHGSTHTPGPSNSITWTSSGGLDSALAMTHGARWDTADRGSRGATCVPRGMCLARGIQAGTVRCR